MGDITFDKVSGAFHHTVETNEKTIYKTVPTKQETAVRDALVFMLQVYDTPAMRLKLRTAGLWNDYTEAANKAGRDALWDK